MTSENSVLHHDEASALLPWLANGRLPPPQREELEAHVRGCAACTEELAFQRMLCAALTAPDRVTYAPGPSFRKLLERIDNPSAAPATRTAARPAASRVRDSGTRRTLWRPPGLAWAASFLLLIGTGLLVATVERWSEPRYVTHTLTRPAAPHVIHIAFDRSLPIGAVEELLKSAGARIVEGPGDTGIFGVTPEAIAAGSLTEPSARIQMQLLSDRLRADPRVRWVEPIALSSRGG